MEFETYKKEEPVTTNVSEIEKVIKDMKESAVGIENYRLFVNKVKNSDKIIMSSIQHIGSEYKRYEQKYIKEKGSESYKQMEIEGYIKLETFEITRMMNQLMREAFNWKSIQQDLYSIVFDKICVVLEDVNALEIKRDALREMKEMEVRRQAMFIEIMSNMTNMFQESVITKLQVYDEKFMNLVVMLDRDNRKDRGELVKVLKVIVTDTNLPEEKKGALIGSSLVDKDEIESLRKRLATIESKEVRKKVIVPEVVVEEDVAVKQDVKIEEKANKNDDIDDEFASFPSDED